MKQKQYVYDNPKTQRREIYRNGELIYSWSREQIRRICEEDPKAARWGTCNTAPPNAGLSGHGPKEHK